ncbi:MAG: hypothetical protein QXU98_14530 [Candidatus Parvarchaeota archaeon]
MDKEEVMKVIKKAENIENSAIMINKMIIEFKQMRAIYDKAFMAFYSKETNKLLFLSWYDYINSMEVI